MPSTTAKVGKISRLISRFLAQNENMSTSRQIVATAAGDLAALALCAAASWWLKSLSDPTLPVGIYLHGLPALLFGSAITYAGLGLYPALGWGAADELKRLSHGTTFIFLASIALTFLSKVGGEWSRQIFLIAWLLALIAVPLARSGLRRLCSRAEWWSIPCAVIGAGVTGERVITLLRSRPWLGLRPVLVLDDSIDKQGRGLSGLPIKGPILGCTAALHQERVFHAILAIPGLPADQLSRMLDSLGDHLRHVFIAPALPGSPDVIATTREFANTLVLEVRQELLRPQARILKRAIDIFCVSAGILLFWWLFAVIALAIRLSSPGTIFYGQTRIGLGGREFKTWKFRSMMQEADTLLQAHLAAHPELRDEWERDHKLKDDPRVTGVGALLRRTSLDELPQLWNILIGQMSLTGPRPIVQAEVARYGERFALICKVRPGLSGLWQVSGRSDTGYSERVALDCYYVRNWSLWLDILIMARTVRVVVMGKGAY